MRRALLIAGLAGLATAPSLAGAGAPAPITIGASTDSSSAGAPVLLTGRAPAEHHVYLWQRLAEQRRFHLIAIATTHPGGAFTFALTPLTNRQWYVAAGAGRSATVRQRVGAVVTLAATPAQRSRAWLSGRVAPSHSGEQVVLEHLGNGWQPLASTRIDGASNFGTASHLSPGAVVRAVFAGDARNTSGASPPVAITLGVDPQLGPSRRLPSNYFGLNWDYPGAALFSSNLPGEYSNLQALHPGTLRWPGGTGANYFQWQQGYPTDGGELNGFPFTLQDLEAAYQATHAAPVFDLNLMTSTLQSQEQMLTQAQALGLPIRYLELGNEFYLSQSDYVNAFPTAADYGRTVAQWVTALHKDFPGAAVAAVGADDVGARSRSQTWNQEMLVAAQLSGGRPDAITLHIKPESTTAVTAAGLNAYFSGPSATVQRTNSVVAALTNPEPTWLTEYNLRPDSASNPGQQVYAHALFVAELELLVQGINGSALVDYWTSFQDSLNGAYVPLAAVGPPTLTPAGLALAWIGSAAAGTVASRPIAFDGGPTLGTGGSPALVGYRFSNDRDVIVNLSPDTVTVPAGTAIPFGDAYQQVTGNPVQSVSYASQLSLSNGTVGDTLTLPPYSLTRVG